MQFKVVRVQKRGGGCRKRTWRWRCVGKIRYPKVRVGSVEVGKLLTAAPAQARLRRILRPLGLKAHRIYVDDGDVDECSIAAMRPIYLKRWPQPTLVLRYRRPTVLRKDGLLIHAPVTWTENELPEIHVKVYAKDKDTPPMYHPEE